MASKVPGDSVIDSVKVNCSLPTMIVSPTSFEENQEMLRHQSLPCHPSTLQSTQIHPSYSVGVPTYSHYHPQYLQSYPSAMGGRTNSIPHLNSANTNKLRHYPSVPCVSQINQAYFENKYNLPPLHQSQDYSYPRVSEQYLQSFPSQCLNTTEHNFCCEKPDKGYGSFNQNMYIEVLESKNSLYSSKLMMIKKSMEKQNSEGPENQDVIMERDKILDQLKHTKKKMEVKERMEQQLRNKVESLSEEIVGLENLVSNLQSEMEYKRENISSLYARIKEIDVKREQLLEENLELQEQAQGYSAKLSESDERYSLEKRLFRQLKCCVSEFKSLMNIIKDHIQGNDPNLSHLLETGLNLGQGRDKDSFSKNSIEEEISEANQLHNQLVKLRDDISDLYAEYLGTKLRCSQQ